MTSPEDDAINAIQSATIAIETELGIDPKGIYSDVTTRLSILESRVGPGRGNGMGLIDINTQTAGNLLVNRISPSFVDGYVIATIGGVAAWSAIGGGALGGDLSGVLSNANVIRIQNHPVNAIAPTDGYVLTWDQSDGYWLPKPTSIIGIIAGGDLTGTYPAPTVAKINAASVPASGSLTTGNALQVNGSSSLTYAPINLAGGTSFVIGALPISNQASQTVGGDLSGTTASATVIKLQTVPVNSLSPTDGYVLTYDQADGYWLPKINTALPAAPDGYLQYRFNSTTFGSTPWKLTASNQITAGAGQQLLTGANNAGTFNYNIFAKDFLFGKDILQIGGTFLGTANTAFDRTTVSATQFIEAFAYDGYTLASISLGTSAVQTNGHGAQVAISPGLTLGSIDTNFNPYCGATNSLRFFNATAPTSNPNSGNLIWSNNGNLTARNAGGYSVVMAPQSIAGVGANPQGIVWAVNMQQTIGTGGANLGAVTPAVNTACIYTASVVGIDIADGYMVSTIITGAARNIGGTVTLIGTPTSVLSIANGSDAALNGCTISVGTSGGVTLLISVAGVTGKTINWTGDIMVREGG